MKNIIGISAFYHDSACCLLQDGRLVAAAQEERFSRIKHDPSFPYKAFQFCLEEGKIDITDIDLLAFYEIPDLKVERQLLNCTDANLQSSLKDQVGTAAVTEKIRTLLGYNGPIEFIAHHYSHAASSFYFSGFEEAAVFTADGVGEWDTTTFGRGSVAGIDLFESVRFPDSLGLLYSMITNFLGFEVNEGEYKVMGLAPYGNLNFLDRVRSVLNIQENGRFSLNLKYFDFTNTERMYTEHLVSLLGVPARRPGTELTQVHKDIARSVQYVLEEVLLREVRYLWERTGSRNLCMAGGVALNCVANARIVAEGPFEHVFIQPASNDAGCAVGAAMQAYYQYSELKPVYKPVRLNNVFLGPSYVNRSVQRILDAAGLKYGFFGSEADILAQTVDEIDNGKTVGWFQGRMEFGPRSLGARSILADPRRPEMQRKVNQVVKNREGFRPFAPVVLEDKASAHFSMDHCSPFMLETFRVISPIQLPAITHVDGSARVQTVNEFENDRFYRLLLEFDRLTGCPILLNTSFNVKNEPIVCSPYDAVRCFVVARLDVLVINDYIIRRAENELEVLEQILVKNHIREAGINYNTYSFL